MALSDDINSLINSAAAVDEATGELKPILDDLVAAEEAVRSALSAAGLGSRDHIIGGSRLKSLALAIADGNSELAGQSLEQIVSDCWLPVISEGGEPTPGTAPVITQQPSITPSSATVGDSVTINLGAATGAVGDPTWTLMRGATDVTAQVDQFMAIEFTTAGTYTLSVSWSNATGPTTATPATITVAEAPSGDVDLSDAAIYIPNTSVTPTDITTLVAGGRSSVTFSAEGTGTAPQVTSRGLDFAVPGQKLASPSVNIAGGFFVTGIAEYDTVAGTIVSVYGANDSNLNIRANSGNRVQINWSYPAATNQNLPIGSLAAGVPAIFGVEVNPTANTLRYWDGTQVVSRSLGGSSGAVLPDAVIRLGGVAHATNERMDGAVSRFVLEPLNGAQITLEQALAELGAPITPPFP